MMTFMRLLYIKDGFVCYEYGRNDEIMIGKITTEIENVKNTIFDYYKISWQNGFCSSTGNAITMIQKFIKENNFPKTYTYAC